MKRTNNRNEKVKKIQHIAVVGGAGHVGLPLSLVLVKAGFKVTIIDIDRKKMDSIKKGEFPFLEEGGEKLLKETISKGLFFSDTHKDIQKCDVIILTVGTPVDKHLNPILDSVFDAIRQIKPFLRDEQVIVLRSTLFPGTSKMIHDMLLSEGLRTGVSFCPERIAQGVAIREIQEFPQIISGVDARSLSAAKFIFSKVAKGVVELDMTEAELAKLFTNAWRYIRFAVANQFYMMVEEKGMDFYKIRDAMMADYPRALDFPAAGFAAGPCLFKDTMQLAAFNRQNFPLGNSAMLVNETLPDFLVEQAKRQLSLKGKRVGILGMAFKANNDDTRESLAFKLRRLLVHEKALLMCTDPHVKDPLFYSLKNVLKDCDILFIGCPHAEYKDIDFRGKIVFDCWGIVHKQKLQTTNKIKIKSYAGKKK